MRKTAAEYRAEASAAHQSRDDSFARSDTDGFLSQWAHGITAQLAEARAKLAENDWQATFRILIDANGDEVPARMIDGRYGLCWALCDSTGKFTGEFMSVRSVPSRPWRGSAETDASWAAKVKRFRAAYRRRIKRRHKDLAERGYREAYASRRAYADTRGSGTGLGGNVWVATFRVEWPWGERDYDGPAGR